MQATKKQAHKPYENPQPGDSRSKKSHIHRKWGVLSSNTKTSAGSSNWETFLHSDSAADASTVASGERDWPENKD